MEVDLYLPLLSPSHWRHLESEFWLALGKVILAVGLICFTFVTMVGGNPQKDAYGFRYWNRKFVFLNHYEH